jgi:uncharacterized protein YjiS (DUF1127 family)
MSCGSATYPRSAPPNVTVAQPTTVRLSSLFGWVQALKRMHDRRQQRRALLNLDDRLLLDIGITREQAEREACKPFWMSGKSPRGFTSLQ